MSGEVASLLAVVVGALIALAATLSAEALRSRRDRAAVLDQVRYDTYLTFLAAVVATNDALHALSVTPGRPQPTEVATAVRSSGLYGARERLLVTGSPAMVLAAETAFRGLLAVRDCVAQGAPLVWPDYRPADDGLARAVWALRQAARREFGGRALDLDRLVAVTAPDITGRLGGGAGVDHGPTAAEPT